MTIAATPRMIDDTTSAHAMDTPIITSTQKTKKIIFPAKYSSLWAKSFNISQTYC